MRFAKISAILAVLASLLFGVAGATSLSNASAKGLTMRHYAHIFVLMEENHSFGGIIGNPAAPEVNKLAQQYGLATNYYGTIHPSEGNYVALIGGNSYNIKNDNPYYTNTVHNPSLVDQLEQAGLSWKGYFQSMPYAGYTGVCYPASCKGPLYASKHNGFLNFIHVQKSKQEQQKLVPISQLDQDLQNDTVPNFSFIAPDQCHDMHGAPPFCPDPGKQKSQNDNIVVGKGDTYAGQLVNEIIGSPVWSHGNTAIVIVWDEGWGSYSGGCCDANPGGGRVPAIVITNNGPRGVQDNTPYNHYSLTATIEQAFSLGCLQYTCDGDVVMPMSPLFA